MSPDSELLVERVAICGYYKERPLFFLFELIKHNLALQARVLTLGISLQMESRVSFQFY